MTEKILDHENVPTTVLTQVQVVVLSSSITIVLMVLGFLIMGDALFSARSVPDKLEIILEQPNNKEGLVIKFMTLIQLLAPIVPYVLIFLGYTRVGVVYSFFILVPLYAVQLIASVYTVDTLYELFPGWHLFYSNVLYTLILITGAVIHILRTNNEKKNSR